MPTSGKTELSSINKSERQGARAAGSPSGSDVDAVRLLSDTVCVAMLAIHRIDNGVESTSSARFA